MAPVTDRKCPTCDAGYDNDDIYWVKCSTCKLYYHKLCQLVDDDFDTASNWICATCKPPSVDLKNENSIVADLLDEIKALRSKVEVLEKKETVPPPPPAEPLKSTGALQKRRTGFQNNAFNFEQSIFTDKSKSQHGSQIPTLRSNLNRISEQEDIDRQNNSGNHTPFGTAFEDPMTQLPENNNALLNVALQQLTNLMIRQSIEPLPDFYGDYETWSIFYAQYRASANIVDAVTNMRRLRASLKGEARQKVMTKLAYTDDPDAIISELKTIYGRTDMVVKQIVRKLRTLAPPDTRNSKSLSNFKGELEDALATLNNLEAQPYLSSPTIVDDILEKLPVEMLRDWARHARNNSLKPGTAVLQDFVEWFVNYTEWINWETKETKVQSNASRTRGNFQSSSPATRRDTHHVNVHEELLDSNLEMLENPRSVSCVVCGKANHTVSNCDKFKNSPLNVRWDIAKKKYLCFMCLDKRHKNECPMKKQCNINDCKMIHHHLLHYEKSTENSKMLSATVQKSGTYYKIIPVKLFGKDKDGLEFVVECNALLDDGSGPTLMTESLADKLNIHGPTNSLCLGWTDGTSRIVPGSRCANLVISGLGKYAPKFVLRKVRTDDKLNLPAPKLNIKELQEKYVHLSKIYIAQPFDEKPLLLIGEDHAQMFTTLDYREGSWNDPIASHTRLGWVVHGRAKDGNVANVEPLLNGFICECKSDNELSELMEEFFSNENFFCRPKIKKLDSFENNRALKILQETSRNIGGRVQVGLLWKNKSVKLPDNKPMALRRLICLERQLKMDPALASCFKLKFQENIEKGYIRKLTKEEESQRSEKTWYLPIFGVRNPHKPDKLRVEYDAAAKHEGTCLNDHLLKGPDLHNSLVGILMKVRTSRVAVAADIKEMYHRILINEEDCNSQRLLWRDNDTSKDPDTYVLQVLSFGARCSPSTAEWIKNENAKKFSNIYARAVQSIISHHYVDDLLDCFDSEEEALKVSEEIRKIHANAGFEIRNWLSNSKQLMNYMNGTPPTTGIVSMNLEKENIDKILGMYWKVDDDVFVFKLNFVRVKSEILELTKIPTKREMLKVLMAIFDPLGFVAPAAIGGKILVQETWRVGLEWDDLLPEELFKKWCKWIRHIQVVHQISVSRCYSGNLPFTSNIEMHIFVDSSELAYCAVSYIRIIHSDGIDVAFIAAKSKVAPRNYVSVPRLELEAARLGVRLAETIQGELAINFKVKHFWTDSQTVLSWIQSDHRKYKQYVANRVGEILETTKMSEWRWIPGKLNVADEATKVHEVVDLSPTSRWFSAPSFLNFSETEWPEWTLKNRKFEETEDELRTLHLVNVHHEIEEPNYELVDVHRFSSFEKYLRTTAWIFRFTNSFHADERPMINGQMSTNELLKLVPELDPLELLEAENFIYKKIQWESFPDEVRTLSSGGQLPRESKLWKLSVYMDSLEVMRLKGRIDATPFVSDDFKRPIILERTHPLTKLLIFDYHKKFAHQCPETIVNELRQRFWFAEMRVAVKSVISKCQLCKNSKAKPSIPEMSPLPPERVMIMESPFSYTGMDFFGPLLVKVGRHHEKRWGVLFTCLVIRAVHIELAVKMDTSSCIIAIRNFMSRRGQTKVIMSDNGTNLRGAESELRRAVEHLDWKQLQTHGQHPLPKPQRTEWKFITPQAPHMGGSWERLIRSVKAVLYQTLKERAPTEEILRNVLIEAENIINSRPLTYKPIDPETQEALTPNHFLQHSGQVLYSPGEFDREDFGRKGWRFAQQLVDSFWKRFIREVLPDMRKRTKWFTDQRPIRLGDIVIAVDESSPRNCWSKGVVIELHPGPDQKTRTVTIKTAVGNYKRPVSKLIVLDVREESS